MKEKRDIICYACVIALLFGGMVYFAKENYDLKAQYEGTGYRLDSTPLMEVLPTGKDVTVSLQQGVFQGDAGKEVSVAAGDKLYYVVSLENHGEQDLYGTLVLPCPVLSETEVFATDSGEVSDQSVRWVVDGLSSGESVHYLVVLTMPEQMSTVAWTVQAQLQCTDDTRTDIFLSEQTASVSFGSSAVYYQLDGDTLVIWNDEDATGGASNIRAEIPVKEGAEIASDEWVVEDGNVVISCGALIPGGKKNMDLSNIIDRLEIEDVVVTYEGGIAEMR